MTDNIQEVYNTLDINKYIELFKDINWWISYKNFSKKTTQKPILHFYVSQKSLSLEIIEEKRKKRILKINILPKETLYVEEFKKPSSIIWIGDKRCGCETLKKPKEFPLFNKNKIFFVLNYKNVVKRVFKKEEEFIKSCDAGVLLNSMEKYFKGKNISLIMIERRRWVDNFGKVIIKSTSSEVENFLGRIINLSRGYTESDIWRFVAVSSEAFDNAIEHGNEFDPSKYIIIDFLISCEGIILDIRDQGPGFMVGAKGGPKDTEAYQGRGIYIMKSLANGLCFVPPGNEVRIFIKRQECPQIILHQ